MSLPSDFPTDKPVILIIDGDVIAFIAAAACEKTVQDEAGNVSTMGFLDEGIAVAAGLIAKFRNQLKPGSADLSDYTIVLSDPAQNYRFDIDRNYKGNRKAGDMSRVPVLLGQLKEWLKTEHSANYAPRLEADDAIALIMTDPALLLERTPIAVGRDKDFKCIPGWHYQYHKGDENVDITPFHISLPEADRWHMMQSLAGDMTDGFPGCPGIGIKRAGVIVDECMLQVRGEGVITRGPNKGKKVARYTQVPAATVWDCIVSHYEKAGLTEMDALITARLAHLLRYGEYNLQTGEVQLWQPNAAQPIG